MKELRIKITDEQEEFLKKFALKNYIRTKDDLTTGKRLHIAQSKSSECEYMHFYDFLQSCGKELLQMELEEKRQALNVCIKTYGLKSAETLYMSQYFDRYVNELMAAGNYYAASEPQRSEAKLK